MIAANGFIIEITSDNHSTLCSIKLPEYPDISSESKKLSKGVTLRTWSAPIGDVNCIKSYAGYYIILNGYISSGPGFQRGKTQIDNCIRIGELFDSERGIDRLKKLVTNLSGSFTITVIDCHNRRVYAATDRVGSRPLWYSTSGESLLVSSHSVAIAQSRRKVAFSPGGVASFLLYGTQVEPSNCLFQDINKVKEGTFTILSVESTPCVHAYYSFKHSPEKRHRKEWVEIVANRLVNAADNLIESNQKIGLFLSGGVDSRLILTALISAGIKPVLITLSDSQNIETRVAKKVATYFALPHEIIIRDQDWYLRSLQNAVYESNGVYSWTHAHFREACHKMYQNHGVDTFLVGDLSEAFSKLFSRMPASAVNLWHSREFLRNFNSLMLPLYTPKNKARTLNLLKPEFREAAVHELNKDIVTRFRYLLDCSTDSLIIMDQFFRWQNANCLPTYEMLLDVRSAARERNLMFDLQMHELIEILPSSIRNRSNFGSDLIKKLNPGVAKLINSNTLLPLGWHPSLHRLAQQARPWVGRVSRFMKNKEHRNEGSWPSKAYLYRKAPNWRTKIESIISNQSLFPQEIFEQSKIHNILKSLDDGDVSAQYDLERIVSIGIITEWILND
ncbi:hypothetical protein FCL47_15190 [Desulfopila sp. IMCC35006]|uniref:asparagine synthase-related protein n=1 Tax=Desulfopila sp. IMCC35006 TaxID=2569542 RepID=UPI0010ABC32E|nr:asparagine synthase-related protein [Desulfopila sp. IMCC35006]TKB24993.1 hypothetical protein FCL47_15190 [Desulfopila sp. IMCC35006]